MGRTAGSKNVADSKIDLARVNLLFTVITKEGAEERGFFYPVVYLVKDGKIIDRKIGNSESLYHASRIVDTTVNDYLTEYLTASEAFFNELDPTMGWNHNVR